VLRQSSRFRQEQKVIFDSSIAALDWLGIVVFTISGALGHALIND